MKVDKTIKYVLCSELLFIMLPILILFFIRMIQNDFHSIIYNSEWSIISTILFGHSIVKFSSGISKSSEQVRWQFVALVVSLIIIFGLIPSVIILAMNLTGEPLSAFTQILQIVLFLASCVTFFIFGAIGQKMLDEA